MKTSLPRTGSNTEMEHSPSANCEQLMLPRDLYSSVQMRSANTGLELPVNTLISLPCEIRIAFSEKTNLRPNRIPVQDDFSLLYHPNTEMGRTFGDFPYKETK